MPGMSTQTRYRVSGMDCASCASKIDTAVRRMDGVADVSVSVTNGSVTVTHAESLGSDAIARQVSRLGYGAAPWDSGDREVENGDGDRPARRPNPVAGQPWWRSRRAKLTIASGVALVAAYAAGLVYPAAGHWPFLAALLVGLFPIARRAGLRRFRRHALLDRDADDDRGRRGGTHWGDGRSGDGAAALPRRRTARRRGGEPRPGEHPGPCRPRPEDSSRGKVWWDDGGAGRHAGSRRRHRRPARRPHSGGRGDRRGVERDRRSPPSRGRARPSGSQRTTRFSPERSTRTAY